MTGLATLVLTVGLLVPLPRPARPTGPARGVVLSTAQLAARLGALPGGPAVQADAGAGGAAAMLDDRSLAELRDRRTAANAPVLAVAGDCATLEGEVAPTTARWLSVRDAATFSSLLAARC